MNVLLWHKGSNHMVFGNLPPDDNKDNDQNFDKESGRNIMMFGIVAIAIVIVINLVKRWLE